MPMYYTIKMFEEGTRGGEDQPQATHTALAKEWAIAIGIYSSLVASCMVAWGEGKATYMRVELWDDELGEGKDRNPNANMLESFQLGTTKAYKEVMARLEDEREARLRSYQEGHRE